MQKLTNYENLIKNIEIANQSPDDAMSGVVMIRAWKCHDENYIKVRTSDIIRTEDKRDSEGHPLYALMTVRDIENEDNTITYTIFYDSDFVVPIEMLVEALKLK